MIVLFKGGARDGSLGYWPDGSGATKAEQVRGIRGPRAGWYVMTDRVAHIDGRAYPIAHAIADPSRQLTEHADVGTDRLLSPHEASELLGVTTNTLANWSRDGLLTAVRTLGGHRRYLESELRALQGA